MKKYLLSLALALAIFFAGTSSALAAASLSFSPASKSVAQNEEFNVDIILNTGGAETDGADVIIGYDSSKLQVVSTSYGTLYENTFSASLATGKITLRATSADSASFSGTGTFATIKFKGTAQGTANTYFDFTSGSTTDTNIAESSSHEDILGSVSGGSYTIGPAAAGGTSSSSSSPSPSPAASSAATVPVSGVGGPTILAIGAALLMFALSFIVFKTI